jgi:hypothetical protein
VDAAWEALLAVAPELSGQDASALFALTGPRVIPVPIGRPPVATMNVELDPAARSFAMQGGWWYRGVVSVTAHADGSLVRRAIYNIAPAPTRWLVAFVHRHDDGAFRREHGLLLAGLGARLSCPARLLEEA